MTEPADTDTDTGTDSARAEAVEVLQDAFAWRLTAQRWGRIEPILEALAAALAAGDESALRAATVDLELAGPVRIGRVGDVPLGPPTPPVRDRLNHLLDGLDGVGPDDGPSRRPADDEAAETDG